MPEREHDDECCTEYCMLTLLILLYVDAKYLGSRKGNQAVVKSMVLSMGVVHTLSTLYVELC